MNDTQDEEVQATTAEQPISAPMNGIGVLETGITALAGLTIEAVTTMPAEVKRESGHYVLLRCKDPDGYVRRIILAYAEAAAPAPNDLDMLKDQVSGIHFFTTHELLTRRLGGSLFNHTGMQKVEQATTEERLSKTIWATPKEDVPEEQSDE